jgi:hypothetical protein
MTEDQVHHIIEQSDTVKKIQQADPGDHLRQNERGKEVSAEEVLPSERVANKDKRGEDSRKGGDDRYDDRNRQTDPKSLYKLCLGEKVKIPAQREFPRREFDERRLVEGGGDHHDDWKNQEKDPENDHDLYC